MNDSQCFSMIPIHLPCVFIPLPTPQAERAEVGRKGGKGATRKKKTQITFIEDEVHLREKYSYVAKDEDEPRRTKSY